jgi:D-alanyl-D-alanine-carboxypeptidase/D-alanyl-D-alanine-endopeptidase
MTRFPGLPNVLVLGAALSAGVIALASDTHASGDKLLDEVLQFTGTVLFLETKVPALVIGAVRNGESAVAGFGRARAESDRAPDGKTLLRIGSITKPFTGAVLAGLLADGKVKLMDPLQQTLGWNVNVPTKDGKQIRLIDLVTHTSGLPREIERAPSPDNNPFQTITKEAFISNLQSGQLLFAPGTGALYSNFAFDLLAQALANVVGKPYEELLQERVLKPAGLTSTVFAPAKEQQALLLQGHNFDGTPLPDVPTVPMIMGSGGLYSTPEDMLRWIAWHLNRSWIPDVEMRLLDHAAYVYRDGLDPVFGLDESGPMDALGLGWIIMMPRGERPLILQKAGGLQGVFSYMAFAPSRGVGAFAAISQFSFGAATMMAKVVNEMIASLAPR